MSKTFGEAVRLGCIDDDAEIVRMSDLLAPAYDRARWKWASHVEEHDLELWRSKLHIPAATEIAESIRQYAAGLNRSCKRDWCASGGLGVVWENGSVWLECANALVPDCIEQALRGAGGVGK